MAARDGAARLRNAREIWARVYCGRRFEETSSDDTLCADWFD